MKTSRASTLCFIGPSLCYTQEYQEPALFVSIGPPLAWLQYQGKALFASIGPPLGYSTKNQLSLLLLVQHLVTVSSESALCFY